MLQALHDVSEQDFLALLGFQTSKVGSPLFNQAGVIFFRFFWWQSLLVCKVFLGVLPKKDFCGVVDCH